MEKTRGDIFISMRSRDLQLTSADNNNNAGTLNLFQNIEARNDEIMTAQLVSATIPNSFYNLSNNNTNNKLFFKEDDVGAYIELTIPDGSYDIDELSAKIKTLMEAASPNNITYTFTYDEINNTLNIKSSNLAYNTFFNFTSNTCRRFLGFKEGEIIITDANGITSNRAVDITDTRNSIYIRLPNLSNNKIIESSSGRYSNAIAQIPISLSRNLYFQYEPPTPFRMELSQKQINSIDINITYQNELEPVNFENADWECNIIISFFLDPQFKKRREKPHINLHEQMAQRVADYRHELSEDERKRAILDNIVNVNNLNLVKSN
tara:strand:- start:480 stop:1442 length:963 start_codon:yes stop_codon:yes gene_type:complete